MYSAIIQVRYFLLDMYNTRCIISFIALHDDEAPNEYLFICFHHRSSLSLSLSLFPRRRLIFYAAYSHAKTIHFLFERNYGVYIP